MEDTILHLRPYLFSFILAFFSTAFFTQKLHEAKQTELSTVLAEVAQDDLLPLLHSVRIWSPELLVAVRIHTLPTRILADRNVRTTIQVSHKWACCLICCCTMSIC